MNDLTVRTRGLGMRFGDVTALDQVDIEAEAGTVLGLLGHNGAGKSTLVHILSTLLKPTQGEAFVAGLDVRSDGAAIRRRIGVVAQQSSVDNRLSGTANLELVARLLGADRRAARRRASDLIDTFDLAASAARDAGTYSGGMRRRLDLAMSIVASPAVLFLDEPTTGLDPVSRVNLWSIVEGLVREGTTVVLTTQDLNEADRLAGSITVLKEGRVVATGTPAELKAATGQRAAHVAFSRGDLDPAADALRAAGYHPTPIDGEPALMVPVDTSAELAGIISALVARELTIEAVALTEPTLDDVYLSLTTSPTAVGTP